MLIYKRGYRIVLGAAGSMFFISLFEFVSRYLKSGRIGEILCHWGSKTLGIYIIQTLIIEVVMAWTVNFDSFNWVLFNFVVAPAISLVVMIVCVRIIAIIEKSKFLSTIVLGK